MFDQWMLVMATDSELMLEFHRVEKKLNGLRTLAVHSKGVRAIFLETHEYFDALLKEKERRGLVG